MVVLIALALAITRAVREFEDSLSRWTPGAKAQAIEQRTGFQVDPEGLKRGDVRWHEEPAATGTERRGRGAEKFWTEPRLAELDRLWALPMTNAERAKHMSEATGRSSIRGVTDGFSV